MRSSIAIPIVLFDDNCTCKCNCTYKYKFISLNFVAGRQVLPIREEMGLYFMYCSLQYIIFMLYNVVVLRRVILYCKVGWCCSPGTLTVHCSRHKDNNSTVT